MIFSKMFLNRLLVIALMGLPLMGYACTDAVMGVVAGQRIVLSDNACAYPERMVFTMPVDFQGEPTSDVTFDSQCVKTKSGFTCRADGQTLMAGSRYKVRTGKGLTCGEKRMEYRCVGGCERVPMVMGVVPYECPGE